MRPEAPWLVALFSSTTCEGCETMRERVAALESPEVATIDVSWQAAREVHERYRISGVPTVVVADHEGVVHRAFVGAVTATDLWAAVAAARDPRSTSPTGSTRSANRLARATRVSAPRSVARPA